MLQIRFKYGATSLTQRALPRRSVPGSLRTWNATLDVSLGLKLGAVADVVETGVGVISGLFNEP